MSTPFLYVTIEKLEKVIDEKTGELKTHRINCSELVPRNFNVNLLSQPATVINEVYKYIGQSVMLPVKEGVTSSGQTYFKLESADIMSINPAQVEQKKMELFKTLKRELFKDSPVPAGFFDLAATANTANTANTATTNKEEKPK